jgi:hypothetical protein
VIATACAGSMLRTKTTAGSGALRLSLPPTITTEGQSAAWLALAPRPRTREDLPHDAPEVLVPVNAYAGLLKT